MTETDTKTQGGQKGGSVAAVCMVSAAERTIGDSRETLPEVSDDKHASRP
ncbi:MAG: hypothetical protein ACK46Q_12855 [Hyphomonas sp.]